jgi:NAD(P)-dependent dehydrogenase (short-subunit alcohol dehydrogenase family)
LSALGADGRVVNVSSAAQAAVTIDALIGKTSLDDMAAYSQSKLAIMMWTNHLASTIKGAGPIVVSVNPGSLLGTKMVKEGFGIDGKDIQIGADILVRASLSDEFVGQSGKYYDNDAGQFGTPHSDALDAGKCAALVQSIENILAKL